MAGPVWPVSVKGVLSWDGRVVVLRNERDEWELPGGRLEVDDASPQEALRREFFEELAIEVQVGELLDSWIYDVAGKRVLIVTYLVTTSEPASLTHSDEHAAVASMTPAELEEQPIPLGYLRSIRAALAV